MEELELPKPPEEKKLPAPPEEKLLPPTTEHHKHLLIIQLLGIAFMVSLPFVGFYFGMMYQKSITPIKTEVVKVAEATITPMPTSVFNDWTTYTGTKSAYTFKYPNDWDAYEIGENDLIVAPKINIEELKKLSGGVESGKNSTILIHKLDKPRDFSDSYMKSDEKMITERKITVGETSAEEYTFTYKKDLEPPVFLRGDKYVDVVLNHKDIYFSLELMNYVHKDTFDKILSTFKFSE